MVIHQQAKTKLKGEVVVPASKSYFQRLVALAVLKKGETIIHGYTPSNDANASLEIAKAMGALVQIKDARVIIKGVGTAIKCHEVNCHESGLAIRMFAPILSLATHEIKLNASGSLLNRPMHAIAESLQLTGKNVSLQDGKAPIVLNGKMNPGNYILDGSSSSQIITGFLMALPFLNADSTLKVTHLKSKPYVDMTLSTLQQAGIEIKELAPYHFYIQGNQIISKSAFDCEADWSGAATWVVAAAIAGQIKLVNLKVDSLQADAKILAIVKNCGAQIEIEKEFIQISNSHLNAFNFDATDCPDLFPVLAALASQCHGESVIKGVHRLATKESDRTKAIVTEFKKLKIPVSRVDDEIRIQGPVKIDGGICDSHNDHRIVMMLAILGLVSENGITIENAEAINKSYPEFLNELNRI